MFSTATGLGEAKMIGLQEVNGRLKAAQLEDLHDSELSTEVLGFLICFIALHSSRRNPRFGPVILT